MNPVVPGQTMAGGLPDRTEAARKVAEELEVTFVAEMLKYAGIGKTSESFGGGAGEDQFASFLQQEQARQIVRNGGFGLAEMIFNAIKDRQDV